MTEKLPEPWLRGALSDVHPLIMPVLFSFQQVREDIRTYTGDLTDEQVWRQLDGLPPLGFHLRHIAGSVDRLVTYLSGEQLSEQQLLFLRQEATAGATLQELLRAVDASLDVAEARVRNINPQTVYDARSVGRRKLPTTVVGLLIHLAEHTQRHLGQAITTAKFLKHMS
ncbi:MAG TPA: DinB family protein [Bryobacteraceae bacterium]|nr:DinB family protein [Bryobacteraceae bacterium]